MVSLSRMRSPPPAKQNQVPIETAAALMQIGELADKTGLSLRTIRHYDDEGLLNPSARSSGGFRLYSADDLDRLLVIRRMKPLGFSIDEMRELLAVIHYLADVTLNAGRTFGLRQRLAHFTKIARERRVNLRTQLAMAEEFVERLEAVVLERGPTAGGGIQ